MQFSGVTIKGEGRGREIGFPTVNIQLSTPEYEEGVFAVRGELNGKKFEGVAHFGPRPTFGDEKLSVEIHIFDFFEDIAEGAPLQFESVGRKIRSVTHFDSAEALQKQIQKDIAVAKNILSEL